MQIHLKPPFFTVGDGSAVPLFSIGDRGTVDPSPTIICYYLDINDLLVEILQ